LIPIFKTILRIIDKRNTAMDPKGLTKQTITYMGITKDLTKSFRVGDGVAVAQRIQESGKERIQIFEGDVIAMRRSGISSTFTVRKISHGVYVERIFPFYAPTIKEVTVTRRGDVRRAKLYYVRGRVGKKARIKEKIVTREQANTQKQEAAE
jgi:large subunit ribosomal protein L19